MRIAIVDDDEQLINLATLWLNKAGHDCVGFTDGEMFIKASKSDSFDAVLLDWMMPKISGVQVLKTLKQQNDWDTPIIFVTGRTSDDDMVEMLNQGAEDYLTKPVTEAVLLARIGVVERRLHKPLERDVLDVNGIQVDQVSRNVSYNHEPVKLTDKEFKLVLFMFQNLGRLLSRNHILSSVWGYDSGVNTRTVDTHISRLRKKLNLNPENGWRLSSIYHQGYRLELITDDEAMQA